MPIYAKKVQKIGTDARPMYDENGDAIYEVKIDNATGQEIQVLDPRTGQMTNYYRHTSAEANEEGIGPDDASSQDEIFEGLAYSEFYHQQPWYGFV